MCSLPFRENDGEDTMPALIELENACRLPVSPRLLKEDDSSHDATTRRSRHHNENARGISDEYMAMTKACIHDHDYFSAERREPYPPRDQISSLSLNDALIQVEIGNNGIEAKSDIRCRNSRVRTRRIVRKSAIVTNSGAQTIKPFTPTKKTAKQPLIIRNCGDGIKLKVPSPRPSITPFPPVDKTSRRNYDEKKLQRNDETGVHQISLEQNPTCNTSADSAYNSLTLSSSSQQRCSSSRPPSGGKRSATGGISSSSSSSDFSSDECSDAERRTQNTLQVKHCEEDNEICSAVISLKPKPQEEAVVVKSRHVTRSGRKIRKHVQRTEEPTALAEEHKASQYVPTPPPPKPKKGRNFRSVPMRLRALPTSFWEEPNQANSSTYTILPPVTPLLHQQEDGDIGDISPVSPVGEKAARATTSTSNCDHGVYHPIIKAGDTDLLLRLFDQVEPTTRSTAIRKKRGRPKCPEYVPLPPRRSSNQNPCTVDSITNKLFPKLSIDNRQSLAALTRSLPRRTPVEIIGQDVKLSSAGSGMVDANDLLLHHHDDNVLLAGLNSLGETRALPESSPVLVERPSRLLPHLSPHKDYSQLLSELTAVL